MRYGFVLDQRTCIGCHACTVACKTEHEVPLGQFRTWVKYVDKGQYPSTTREFAVMRCNHCTDAPCITICPTQALFKRPDGIVDFDSDRCIGCKSCLQGCPYDAIYIDENTHTAAKCNFCAHRIDQGLEPACVVVCPTESIRVGDLDDPTSQVSALIATHDTAVRSPEQNTGPNVFYLGADRAVLDPLAAPVDGSYIWADPDAQRRAVATDQPRDPVTHARTTLNTAHPRPWGWRVTTYLWTKSVGAGALMVATLAYMVGIDLGVVGRVVAPALSLVMIAATGLLLIWDLKRPWRFPYIFLKANRTSWLVWGSFALTIYGALSFAWLVLGVLGQTTALHGLAGFAAAGGVAAAGYTGFLFGQAEGRDLWQSPLLLWHLLVQAVMVGSGALAIAAAFAGSGPTAQGFLARTFVVATALHVLILLAEYLGRHPSKGAALAAHMITHGRYAATFWWGAVVLATVSLVLVALGWNGRGVATLVVIGALLVQAALLAYESVFIRAGQDVPLS
ncbi:MAG: 4Fe-4S dicluster domain-containing protein [Actinomycetes bacterium]